MPSSPLWPGYNEYRATMVGFLEGMAERAISRGELRIADPEAWALALFAALGGVLAYVFMDNRGQADPFPLSKRIDRETADRHLLQRILPPST